jgi:hypothetical protein
MTIRYLSVVLGLSTVGVSMVLGQANKLRVDGQDWRRHVEVLAADDMEGRGLGTQGLRRAQAYVTEELRKSGVAPAGRTGFDQPVPLASREVIEQESSIAFVHGDKTDSLVVGEDAFFLPLVGHG